MISKEYPEGIEKYAEGQKEEINSPLNRWGAGIAVGHDPTPNEAAMHYIESGGAKEYRKKYNEEHGIKTNE